MKELESRSHSDTTSADIGPEESQKNTELSTSSSNRESPLC